MKNTRIILITALTAIGLMAIGCMSSSNSMPVQEQSDKITTEDFSSWGPTVFLNQTGQEFYYDVGPRYMATFTKTEIGLVRSIAEFENLNFGTRSAVGGGRGGCAKVGIRPAPGRPITPRRKSG